MKSLCSKLLPLLLPLAMHSAAFAGVVKEHPGHWMGDLKLPDGRVLKSGIEFFDRADGSPWASMASPDQGAYDIPVQSIDEKGNTVELRLAFGTMTMTWVSDHFDAQWKQGGMVFPLELKQVAAFPAKLRPQTPVAPFPYAEQQLSIPAGDVTLGATLTIPAGVTKPNVVILVHGSGPVTRDEEVEGHRIFAVLADHLARQGIAVVRYDKRGISRSTGDYENHTQQQLADDLAAVVTAVRARGQFRHIGLVGHSEGPMIAASVAARQPAAVDFLVSMAGVGLPGLEMMLLQDRQTAQDNGASPDETERLMAYIRRFYEIVIAETDKDARIASLKAMQAGLPEADRALIAKYHMNRGTLSLGMAAQPSLRILLTTNAQADWRRVHCPVLALNGTLDHQVPPQSMDGIVAALHDGGNAQVEAALMPSLNHLFQTAKTGNESEYGAIDETIAPAVLEKIATFARKH